MDYSNIYSIPASNNQQQYEDDGLGTWDVDMGGSSYQQPALADPDDLGGLDFMSGFVSTTVEPPAAEAKSAQTPQPAADAADAGDAELEAALDQELFAEKSQQADEESDVETVDEAVDSDAEDARSRESSQQPEDPAQAEQQKQNAWYKECYDAMTEAQRNRLEAFNRSSLQKKTMKKVLQELTGSTNPNDKVLVALSAVTKMHVGELVATARQIAACHGHTGALLPRHIRAAYQVLCESGKVPHKQPSKPLKLR